MLPTETILFGLALALSIWALSYAVRRWLPSWWAPLTRWPSPSSPVSHIIQGLPSLVIGAVVGALRDGNPAGAAFGAVFAAFAPIGHHILKASPLAYRGPLRDLAWMLANRGEEAAGALDRELKRREKARAAGSILLVLLLSGCIEKVNSAREACYANARITFHLEAEECETRSCIAAASEREREAQEACP